MAIEKPDYNHAAGVFAVDVAGDKLVPAAQLGFQSWIRDGVGRYRLQCVELIGFYESLCQATLPLNEGATIGAQVVAPGVVQVNTYTTLNVPVDVAAFSIVLKQIDTQTGPAPAEPAVPTPIIIPSGGVDSVFARTGDVIAVAGDYLASQVDNDSGVAGATVALALDALLALIGAIVTGGNLIDIRLVTVGPTFTPSAQTNRIFALLQGGGGGGGGSATGVGVSSVGAGGGAGALVAFLATVTPSVAIPVTIGAGGNGGAAGGGAANPGTATTMLTRSAGGGARGDGQPVADAGGLAVRGGLGGANVGAGPIVLVKNGQSGGTGFQATFATSAGGLGASSPFGSGGLGGSKDSFGSTINGAPANGAGSGGGGGTNGGSGGEGAQGTILVFEFS